MTTADTLDVYAVETAYRIGYDHALHAFATRAEALAGSWKPYRAPTWEQQVARRIAQFEAIAAKSGRPEWVGIDNGAQAVTW